MLEVTKRVVGEYMQGVYNFLKFTTETEEDFEDRWLPTFDLSLRVYSGNNINWKYLEKPTTSRTTIKQRSAMGNKTVKQILANDMVRRLLNTGEGLPKEEIAKVVDGYGSKLLRSSHKLEEVREIVTAGIRGYRTAAESLNSRQHKKIMGAKDWYRAKKRKSADMIEEDDREDR